MTAPRFRRHRQDGRAPAFAGDFTDDGRDITEVIGRPADWDGSTYAWAGASNVGLPDGDHDPTEWNPPSAPGPQAHPHGHFTGIGDETAWHPAPGAEERRGTAPPGAARTRAPDMFPALRAGPPPAAQHEPRDTGPQQRLPRFSRTAARPRPQRAPDCAIFIWSDLLGQHIMKCGVCLRSRYADPIAGSMPFTFEALRVSAHVSGWRLDAFGRWACPACQETAAYWSPRQVIQWDGDALDAYLAYRAGDMRGRTAPRYGIHPAPEYPEFAEWYDRVGPEVAFRAAAELDLIDDVAAGVKHGRHAAVTR